MISFRSNSCIKRRIQLHMIIVWTFTINLTSVERLQFLWPSWNGVLRLCGMRYWIPRSAAFAKGRPAEPIRASCQTNRSVSHSNSAMSADSGAHSRLKPFPSEHGGFASFSSGSLTPAFNAPKYMPDVDPDVEPAPHAVIRPDPRLLAKPVICLTPERDAASNAGKKRSRPRSRKDTVAEPGMDDVVEPAEPEVSGNRRRVPSRRSANAARTRISDHGPVVDDSGDDDFDDDFVSD